VDDNIIRMRDLVARPGSGRGPALGDVDIEGPTVCAPVASISEAARFALHGDRPAPAVGRGSAPNLMIDTSAASLPATAARRALPLGITWLPTLVEARKNRVRVADLGHNRQTG
jgi:hypothetical protein